MRRRDFVSGLIGTAALPLAAHGQQAAMPVIGFMDVGSPVPNAQLIAAFKRGLNEAGFVEGQNVLIEYRWADGEYGRLPELAAQGVEIPPTLLARADDVIE